MKVIVTREEGSDSNDWCYAYSVLMVGDNARSIEAGFVDGGEPEDANLNRDFKDVYKIPEMLRAAYEAGKRGEGFILEEKEETYE